MREALTIQIICLLVFLVATLAIASFGFVFNIRWKESDMTKYCGVLQRGIIGISSWVFIFSLYGSIQTIIINMEDEIFNYVSVCATFLALTLAFLLPTFIYSKKDGLPPVTVCLYALLASMGSISGVILTISLIGIPFKRIIKSHDFKPLRVVEKNKEVVNVIDENGNLETLENYSYSDGEK